mmetsp:Transcript_78491/g.202128  ORF Transcript_78491/g.202128 Transcript_78491/m.202128 type:complete len:343 (+) Transcript_78491:52-1080(+)
MLNFGHRDHKRPWRLGTCLFWARPLHPEQTPRQALHLAGGGSGRPALQNRGPLIRRHTGGQDRDRIGNLPDRAAHVRRDGEEQRQQQADATRREVAHFAIREPFSVGDVLLAHVARLIASMSSTPQPRPRALAASSNSAPCNTQSATCHANSAQLSKSPIDSMSSSTASNPVATRSSTSPSSTSRPRWSRRAATAACTAWYMRLARKRSRCRRGSSSLLSFSLVAVASTTAAFCLHASGELATFPPLPALGLEERAGVADFQRRPLVLHGVLGVARVTANGGRMSSSAAGSAALARAGRAAIEESTSSSCEVCLGRDPSGGTAGREGRAFTSGRGRTRKPRR